MPFSESFEDKIIKLLCIIVSLKQLLLYVYRFFVQSVYYIKILYFYRKKISTVTSGRPNNVDGHPNPPSQDGDKYTSLEIRMNSASDYSELNMNDNSEYELNNLWIKKKSVWF